MEQDLTETTIASATHYQGTILTLRKDRVRMPNGRITVREVVEHSDSVCMVPLDADGNVLLVRQYRKPTESALLECPAGGIEEGETPGTGRHAGTPGRGIPRRRNPHAPSRLLAGPPAGATSICTPSWPPTSGLPTSSRTLTKW